MRAVMRRRAPTVLAVLATATVLAASGSEGNSVKDSATVDRGPQLFADRCSGCHTLDKVGAQGSATKVRDRERVDGPNFNTRCEPEEDVLYAIRNGGFSGAIMPENIVVGKQAQQIADFLAEYSGRKAKAPKGPNTG